MMDGDGIDECVKSVKPVVCWRERPSLAGRFFVGGDRLIKTVQIVVLCGHF